MIFSTLKSHSWITVQCMVVFFCAEHLPCFICLTLTTTLQNQLDDYCPFTGEKRETKKGWGIQSSHSANICWVPANARHCSMQYMTIGVLETKSFSSASVGDRGRILKCVGSLWGPLTAPQPYVWAWRLPSLGTDSVRPQLCTFPLYFLSVEIP